MVKYCSKCGTPNEDSAQFCVKCRNKFDVQPDSNRNVKVVTMSIEAYNNLIKLLNDEKKSSLYDMIAGFISGTFLIAFGILGLTIINTFQSEYPNYDYTSIHYLMVAALAMGVLLFSFGIGSIFGMKKWERWLQYYKIK